jgi:hypothetical protein
MFGLGLESWVLGFFKSWATLLEASSLLIQSLLSFVSSSFSACQKSNDQHVEEEAGTQHQCHHANGNDANLAPANNATSTIRWILCGRKFFREFISVFNSFIMETGFEGTELLFSL